MRIILIIVLIFVSIGCSHNLPVDYFVEGTTQPVINLNGIWKINVNPPENFWESDDLDNGWKDIRVPGECMMQGFPVKHDQAFVYKKNIEIPTDFKGKEIILRFDGVYSYAKVWINGNYIRDHSGGFTRWECNITPYVEPGESAILTLEVIDKADDISYGSGYAKHQIGGILRDVNLLALPANYPCDLSFITDFDENYTDAILTVEGKLNQKAQKAKIRLELYDKSDKRIILQNSVINLLNSDTFIFSNHIQSPCKWDAEHPNLYNLSLSYFENDRLVYQKTHHIGFREIEISGNKLMVNGSEVKLRGACRHDIHPLLGRVSTPEYEIIDVLLAKEANINFIRTSHYPPTENFLTLCDQYGIYVEDETAVCFVGSHRTEEYYPGASESDSSFTKRYLSQLIEMVTNHRNHPSVIIWSIGNENSYGTNFKKSYDWVKANDPTRPVMFSYPGHVPDSTSSYDILSMHYPGISGNMNQVSKVTKEFGYTEMPVLFDEWAHVACYNNFTVMEDPNIRSFWGQSLDSMWTKLFESDGGLGGAIWGMIDETFMLPDSLPGFNEWWGKIDKNVIPAEYSGQTIGYGEWGIIDTWRRKKPEFWNTKKAYSPVKLLQTTFEDFNEGTSLTVPVYNRFDHTNLCELTLKYTHQGKENILSSVAIEPHSKGLLSIPLEHWDPEDPVQLDFFDGMDRLVDSYVLRLMKGNHNEVSGASADTILVYEEENSLTVNCGDHTKIVFKKSTGLIDEVQQQSETFSFSGPYLNLRTRGESVIYSYHHIKEYGKSWKLKSFDYIQDNDTVTIAIIGEYKDLAPVEYKICILPDGTISVKYDIMNIPHEYIREIGLKFKIENMIDSISWKRDAYWSYYPSGHLSTAEGKVSLYSEIHKSYRIKPGKDWVFDTKSFYYDGIDDETTNSLLTNVARATKENITEYSLHKDGQSLISVIGNGNISTRIDKAGNIFNLFLNNKIDYVDLSWGNYQRNILLEDKYSDTVLFRLNRLMN